LCLEKDLVGAMEEEGEDVKEELVEMTVLSSTDLEKVLVTVINLDRGILRALRRIGDMLSSGNEAQKLRLLGESD
jgi:hypothetical protein